MHKFCSIGKEICDMKEYSNAFKKDYWYDKFVEIFNSGVVYYGDHEREFIKAVRDK